MKSRIPVEAYVLDEAEVEEVRYVHYKVLESAFRRQDPAFVPADLDTNVRSQFRSILVNALQYRYGCPLCTATSLHEELCKGLLDGIHTICLHVYDGLWFELSTLVRALEIRARCFVYVRPRLLSSPRQSGRFHLPRTKFISYVRFQLHIP
jgi:hypothetical protein